MKFFTGYWNNWQMFFWRLMSKIGNKIFSIKVIFNGTIYLSIYLFFAGNGRNDWLCLNIVVVIMTYRKLLPIPLWRSSPTTNFNPQIKSSSTINYQKSNIIYVSTNKLSEHDLKLRFEHGKPSLLLKSSFRVPIYHIIDLKNPFLKIILCYS